MYKKTEKKKARLTKKTKYYIGNTQKFWGKSEFSSQSEILKVKWLKKVGRKKFLNYVKQNNRDTLIYVKNGKVVSLVTNVVNAG